VLPKELLPFFLPFPGPIVDDSGGITEEFIRFLHLPPSTVTELQNLIDVTSSSVENLMRKSAHYNYDETGQIDWVYIAPYDDDALRKSFANSLTRLLSKDFAETILQEHSFINKMFGTLSGGERTYRFEHLNDRIRVYTGMTSNPAEADVTVFLDLPEKLPWWIARIIEVEETPEN
jgi:hypothetical protein